MSNNKNSISDTIPITIIICMVLFVVGWLGYYLGAKYYVNTTMQPKQTLSQSSSAPLPHFIFVRGNRWEIVRDPSTDKILISSGFDAITDCKQQVIFIREHLPHNDEADTVWHELLHAGTCTKKDVDNTFWNSNNESTHIGIYRLSSYFSELFRENPDLVKYLSE